MAAGLSASHPFGCLPYQPSLMVPGPARPGKGQSARSAPGGSSRRVPLYPKPRGYPMALRAIGVEPVAQVPSGWTHPSPRAGEDPVGPGGRRIDSDHRHRIDLAHVRDHRNLWQGHHDPIEVEVDSSSVNLDAGSPARGRPWSREQLPVRAVDQVVAFPTPAPDPLSRQSFGASRYMLSRPSSVGRAGHSRLPRLLGRANLDVWISCALELTQPSASWSKLRTGCRWEKSSVMAAR
jgi:hypothetical protein